MPWAILAPIIAQYGLEIAQYIIAAYEKGGNATSADVTALLAMENRTGKDAMLETLKAQGIDANSPQGIAFLALVS